ncbi:hypothetical protein [Olivibacter oleidegradans]|uniref:Uncharacterized protein n=1 Tax=Olivibacter oleidegradans TaxID=760123 RepID=A0ABV6HG72_9SPHI
MRVRQMMRFIDNILKLDYSLSDWFSKTNQTIIARTAFLFLNKLAFLVSALYFIILPILPIQLGIEVSVAILCGLVVLVMYGLQSKIQAAIENLNYYKEYSKLDTTTKRMKRILGVGLFITCFILMFVSGVSSFTRYGDKVRYQLQKKEYTN